MTDRAGAGVAAGVVLCSVLWLAAVLLGGPVLLAIVTPVVLLVAGIAGRRGGRRTFWLPLLLPPVAALLTLPVTGGVDSSIAVLIGLAVSLWCPWLVGRWLRARAALAEAGWRTAVQWEDRAREAEDGARQRERERVAARMHDLVGHDLARAALTLGGLELDRDLPDRARHAVGQAREQVTTAAEHLAEAVSAVDSSGASAGPADEVSGLVRGLRTDGHDVVLVPADPAPVLAPADPAVRSTVQRTVREGLTNALKHTIGTTTEVSLVDRSGEIVVVVRSHGADRRPGPASSGRGLASLRADVEALGGALDHGPAGAGYLLVVRLPVRAGPAEAGPTGVDRARRTALGRVRRSRGVAVRGIAAALATSLLLVAGYRVADVATSVLPAATFDALAVGDERAAVADALPFRTRTDGTGIPAPPGTRCEHYSAVADPLSADLYRLCWSGGRLAHKDLVRRSATDPGTIGT